MVHRSYVPSGSSNGQVAKNSGGSALVESYGDGDLVLEGDATTAPGAIDGGSRWR
jgi:hypothetical protein